MRISRVPLCHVARGGVRAADNDFDGFEALDSRTGMRMWVRDLGVNALDHASDLIDLGKAPRSGGDQSAIRLVSQRDAAWACVLLVAVAARA
ncbi:hypothetical protein OHT68_29920 [Streptomyces canus]|uniref:hypothetical protein n=1 Tax=Streptomyces canus TaxID=58343 RepID=UPI002E2BB3E0|nr:hypothetical protein [Streptomyces canus]